MGGGGFNQQRGFNSPESSQMGRHESEMQMNRSNFGQMGRPGFGDERHMNRPSFEGQNNRSNFDNRPMNRPNSEGQMGQQNRFDKDPQLSR